MQEKFNKGGIVLDSFSAFLHKPKPQRNDAIEREIQLHGWLRKKKVALIGSVNPEWNDLYDELDWK
jgi:predicted GIY-YIG superfamily endonuclease